MTGCGSVFVCAIWTKCVAHKNHHAVGTPCFLFSRRFVWSWPWFDSIMGLNDVIWENESGRRDGIERDIG